MFIRNYREADIDSIVDLFYGTVHAVNKRDYSREQLDAWASANDLEERRESWRASLSRNIAFVAEKEERIVGFTDMNRQGYLDRLFVHKDYQGQGIASALISVLESEARKSNLPEITTNASITAKPFFESKGYRVVRSQIVERKGVELVNYKMIKELNPQ
ncbi:GNAT family N-acetyltransferase [Cohnella xylanilytica]|uniref:GNAT family N-acetyltransferase n=1 Tax=Cohnella xylanilytica TaxID=557555 RepID=A0A841UAA8_9BACL|nr:GNAT family N-acetyltransferase [Cohnella xylanilytica]MBB6695074.1 GNAT family N-acetyltransferase [Cohnella xylanilytica]